MFGDFELHCRLGPFVGFMSSLCDNYFFFLGLVKWSTVEEMGWYSRYLVEDIGQSIYSGNVILSVVFFSGFLMSLCWLSIVLLYILGVWFLS